MYTQLRSTSAALVKFDERFEGRRGLNAGHETAPIGHFLLIASNFLCVAAFREIITIKGSA